MNLDRIALTEIREYLEQAMYALVDYRLSFEVETGPSGFPPFEALKRVSRRLDPLHRLLFGLFRLGEPAQESCLRETIPDRIFAALVTTELLVRDRAGGWRTPNLLIVPTEGLLLLVNIPSSYPTATGLCATWLDPSSVLMARSMPVSAAGKAVLDVCSGSGLLGLLCAVRGAKYVVGLELNEDAVTTARANSILNGLDHKTEFRQSDKLASLSKDEIFDLVVCNPPYTVLNGDQAPLQLETLGNSVLLQSLEDLPRHLAPEGQGILGCWLALGYRSSTYQMDKIMVDLERAGFSVLTYSDRALGTTVDHILRNLRAELEQRPWLTAVQANDISDKVRQLLEDPGHKADGFYQQVIYFRKRRLESQAMERAICGLLSSADPGAPPEAKKRRSEIRVHGEVLVDPYRWLQEKSNPEVVQYLEAENAYTESIMRPLAGLQRQIYEEVLGRIQENDVSVPHRKGDYFYYSRWEAGKQYPIWSRRKLTIGAREEIALDLNQLCHDEKFLVLGSWAVSDDGNLLLYRIAETGHLHYHLRIRDLRSGTDLSDIVEKTGSAVWAGNNHTIFYTVEDHAKRAYRLYRHELGSAVQSDQLVYEEKDERFSLHLEKSRSQRYLFLTVVSHTSSEVWHIEASRPLEAWKRIVPRKRDVEYYVDHIGNQFYIRTNDTGRNFRLAVVPVDAPEKENWREVVAARDHVMLCGFEPFKDFHVLVEREDGLTSFTVIEHGGGRQHRLAFSEAAYNAVPYVNFEFDTQSFRYLYQSLITPVSVFEYDLEKRTSTPLKQAEVGGGYRPGQYQSERVWATAKDNARIPISLVYRKDLKKSDGSNPLYLHSYGAYGAVVPLNFDSTCISLLDRGVVMAYPHVRGGGDLGKKWHDAGRMANKMNTFTDFIACAEYLLDHRYGERGKIVIEGGSAGGLLMGAVTNMRPDLFRVVVLHVPFVDLINTLLDPTLPLTVAEYEEWGDPAEEPAFRNMREYSPYDNLKKGSYPAMLVATSLNDSHVMYWEAAKYVAKLRTLKTDSNVLLLRTDLSAGHSGASGRYDRLEEIAINFTFILTQLGIDA